MLTIALRVTCFIGAAAVAACREPARDHQGDVPNDFQRELEQAERESRRAAERLEALPEELDEAGRAIKGRMQEEKQRLDQAITDFKRDVHSPEAQDQAARARRSLADVKRELKDAVDSFGRAWDDYEAYFQGRVRDVLTDERIEEDARAVKEGRALEIDFAFRDGAVDVEKSRASIERLMRVTNVCPTARFSLAGTGATKEDGRRRAELIVEALRSHGAPVARIVELGGEVGDGEAVVRVVRTCT